MAVSLSASDFDKFAKSTIRELGHRSDTKLTTDAILQYLDQHKIAEPEKYLLDVMQKSHVIDADDPNLNEIEKSYVRSGEVKQVSSFGSTYFNIGVTSYELWVRVWDLRNGTQKVTAQIYLNAL